MILSASLSPISPPTASLALGCARPDGRSLAPAQKPHRHRHSGRCAPPPPSDAALAYPPPSQPNESARNTIAGSSCLAAFLRQRSPEPVGFISGLNDVGLVRQSVQHRFTQPRLQI